MLFRHRHQAKSSWIPRILCIVRRYILAQFVIFSLKNGDCADSCKKSPRRLHPTWRVDLELHDYSLKTITAATRITVTIASSKLPEIETEP